MSDNVKSKILCPDCGEGLSRRDFVKTLGGAALAVGAVPLFTGRALAAPSPASTSETAAKALHESLTEDQRKVICFPYEHDLRHRISANWAITDPTIGQFFNQDQQALIDQVFRGLTSQDGYERFLKQMEEDAGGFGEYHVALFGEPGSGQFEFEMTGRHLTLRADGDCAKNAAFGGPIVYGHGTGGGEAGLPGNVFFYQTQKANEVFAALDEKQREKALLADAPEESAVAVQGPGGAFPGIAVGDLSSDQRDLVESVIKVVLGPYREEDVEEAVSLLKADGDLERLHMAFYRTEDLGGDQVWDVWRLEGPSFVSHFRGSPHVHAYINITKKDPA